MKKLEILLVCSVFLLCFAARCEMGQASLSSRMNVVNEREVTHFSYDNIENTTYLHIELPDTLENAHTIAVCAYAYGTDVDTSCCQEWLFEGVDEFWISYAHVQNCIVKITCWGTFGSAYITGVF